MSEPLYIDGTSKPQQITFVYNPEDWEYISNWILRHHPDQRAHLFVAAAMGWNLALYLSNKDN
jgi:cyanophycinase-like exopeptidase